MNINLRRFLALAAIVIAGASLSLAKNKEEAAAKGQVYVNVLPEEAYIWVDGKPMSHRSSMLKLAPGEHTVTVYNYGYEPQTTKVTVQSGQYQEINAYLKSNGGPVSGPWGRIQIEGVPGDSLVFLNGTTPEFFVGHADEMNNNFIAKQQLITPVGKQQLYIVRRSTDRPIWSGPVDVQEDKRLIVYVKGENKAKMVYKSWSEGKKIKSLKRFEAGTASATIAVAPVTAKLTADTPAIQCDQTGKLTWSSANAAQTTITGNNQKLADAASGNLAVQPKQTTKYELRAAGPGGVVTQDATINVDATVKASLKFSDPEIRFVKVGDEVKEQGSANLVWSATNADQVQIDRIGTVSGGSGSQMVQASPKQTSPGPVNETETYKITATNTCGGSDTATASILVTGSIGPEVIAEVIPPELPQTASPLPLLALLGLGSLGAGSILRLRRTRRMNQG